MIGKVEPVSIARATVKRTDGSVEVYYSCEKVPLREVRRRIKLHKHLQFMKKEDRNG